MIGQLQDPFPGFEDVIKTHFYLKKERIIQVCYSLMQSVIYDIPLGVRIGFQHLKKILGGMYLIAKHEMEENKF